MRFSTSSLLGVWAAVRRGSALRRGPWTRSHPIYAISIPMRSFPILDRSRWCFTGRRRGHLSRIHSWICSSMPSRPRAEWRAPDDPSEDVDQHLTSPLEADVRTSPGCRLTFGVSAPRNSLAWRCGRGSYGQRHSRTTLDKTIRFCALDNIGHLHHARGVERTQREQAAAQHLPAHDRLVVPIRRALPNEDRVGGSVRRARHPTRRGSAKGVLATGISRSVIRSGKPGLSSTLIRSRRMPEIGLRRGRRDGGGIGRQPR